MHIPFDLDLATPGTPDAIADRRGVGCPARGRRVLVLSQEDGFRIGVATAAGRAVSALRADAVTGGCVLRVCLQQQ
jgi:hypothetical protein